MFVWASKFAFRESICGKLSIASVRSLPAPPPPFIAAAFAAKGFDCSSDAVPTAFRGFDLSSDSF